MFSVHLEQCERVNFAKHTKGIPGRLQKPIQTYDYAKLKFNCDSVLLIRYSVGWQCGTRDVWIICEEWRRKLAWLWAPREEKVRFSFFKLIEIPKYCIKKQKILVGQLLKAFQKLILSYNFKSVTVWMRLDRRYKLLLFLNEFSLLYYL